MFDTKEPYNLGVRPRFWPYDVFTLRKPYKSGFSRTSANIEIHLLSLSAYESSTGSDHKESSQIKQNYHKSRRNSSDHTEPSPITQNYHKSRRTITDHAKPF